MLSPPERELILVLFLAQLAFFVMGWIVTLPFICSNINTLIVILDGADDYVKVSKNILRKIEISYGTRKELSNVFFLGRTLNESKIISR